MKVRRAVGGGEPCLSGRSIRLLPPACCRAGKYSRCTAPGVTRAAKEWDSRMDRDVNKSTIVMIRTCSPSDNVCDLAFGMPRVEAIQKPAANSKISNGVRKIHCYTASPPVRWDHVAHSLEICMRAAFCASSSQRLLSAWEAWPLVHSHFTLWRDASSSSSCHRS